MQPLHLRLGSNLAHLGELARTSKIISINVALLAEQLEANRIGSTAAIKVVALEIQRLSDESGAGVERLHGILDDLRLLTQTINVAGRQRMLSQRVMKLALIARLHAAPDTAAECARAAADFSHALTHLARCPLNTAAIDAQLAHASVTWQSFLDTLAQPDLSPAITLNDRVLQEMHAIVQAYEELTGHPRTALPKAS